MERDQNSASKQVAVWKEDFEYLAVFPQLVCPMTTTGDMEIADLQKHDGGLMSSRMHTTAGLEGNGVARIWKQLQMTAMPSATPIPISHRIVQTMFMLAVSSSNRRLEDQPHMRSS